MLTFTVPGRPIPKGRPRLGKGHTYTPETTKQYEVEVRIAALNAMPTDSRTVPLYPTGSVSVTIDLFTNVGDIDNLGKSILDALNGTAWKDDKQVVVLYLRKFKCSKGAQRAVITVKDI